MEKKIFIYLLILYLNIHIFLLISVLFFIDDVSQIFFKVEVVRSSRRLLPIRFVALMMASNCTYHSRFLSSKWWSGMRSVVVVSEHTGEFFSCAVTGPHKDLIYGSGHLPRRGHHCSAITRRKNILFTIQLSNVEYSVSLRVVANGAGALTRGRGGCTVACNR